MLPISLGSNNLEKKEHKWLFFYKGSSNLNCAKSQICLMSLKSTAILQIAQHSFLPKRPSQPEHLLQQQ